METFFMIVEKLTDIPPISAPIALTIGTFDGVHLGHQYLLSKLKKRGFSAVLTFTEPPADVLHHQTTPLICTIKQKLSRLQAHGADLIISLPFTLQLAALPYDTFLRKIRDHLPFSYLILGEGATFGNNAEGNESNIRKFSTELNFEPIYLPKFTFEGEIVSSKKIRALIEQNNFQQALRLLGKFKENLW